MQNILRFDLLLDLCIGNHCHQTQLQQTQCTHKIDRVALLITDPPLCKIHHFGNPPMYIAISFEPIMIFLNLLLRGNTLWKFRHLSYNRLDIGASNRFGARASLNHLVNNAGRR